MPRSTIDHPLTGRQVHRKEVGFILVVRGVAPNGDVEYGASNDLGLLDATRTDRAQHTWAIERYHRGLKPCCWVARAHVRKAVAQQNHLVLAIRAVVRLEVQRLVPEQDAVAFAT